MRAAIGLLCLTAAIPLAAQDFAFIPRVQPEVRGDVAVARHTTALAMAGANVPLGLYVRAGLSVGAGVAAVDGGAFAARADLALRFLLDPFGETPWGPYAGGGLTVRRDGPDPTSAGLLLVLGVEGRRGTRWTPAVEVLLGEGVRVAAVLRRARKNGR